jgi:hypothetical protein
MLFSKEGYLPNLAYPAISLIDGKGKVNYCKLSISQERHKLTNNEERHNTVLNTQKRSKDLKLDNSNIKIKNIEFNSGCVSYCESLKLIPLPGKRKDIIPKYYDINIKRPNGSLKTLETPILTPKRIRNINYNDSNNYAKPCIKTMIRNNSYVQIKENKLGKNIEFNPIVDYYKIKQLSIDIKNMRIPIPKGGSTFSAVVAKN